MVPGRGNDHLKLMMDQALPADGSVGDATCGPLLTAIAIQYKNAIFTLRSGKTLEKERSIMAKAAKKSSPRKKKKSDRPLTFVCAEAGNDESTERAFRAAKPIVDQVSTTPHKSSRNGTDIDHIVVHYTTSRSLSGTLEWFKNPVSQVSAHYVIARDGKLVQVVSDSENSWHAGNRTMNKRSIGIEHSAKNGDAITAKQAEKSAALIAWLMDEYGVAKANVIPHVCVKPTDCCGDLFKDFGGAAGASCDKQKTALHKWMTSVGL